MAPTVATFPPKAEEILARAASVGASDVHLATGHDQAWIRRGAHFGPDPSQPRLSRHVVEQCARANGGAETSKTHLLAGNRWRVTSYRSDNGWTVAFRIIPTSPVDFDEMGLPQILRDLTDCEDGLIIAAAPPMPSILIPPRFQHRVVQLAAHPQHSIQQHMLNRRQISFARNRPHRPTQLQLPSERHPHTLTAPTPTNTLPL